MTKDLTKLTKAELIALLEDSAKEAPPPTTEPGINDLVLALVAEKTTTQALRKALEDNDQKEKKYKLVNTQGVSLTFGVTNPKTLQRDRHHLEMKGSFVWLTQEQIKEAQEQFPDLFERGYLAVPELIEPNVNTILSYQDFLDGLEVDSVESAIGKIEELNTLYGIYNYIENMRFTHLDESGKPLLRKGEGGKDEPYLRENTLNPVTAMAYEAVRRRLTDVTGVNYITAG